MEKTERRYFQIIRIWDLLSQQNLARTIQRLENLFSMYTDDYLDHCRRVQTQGYELFIVNELYSGSLDLPSMLRDELFVDIVLMFALLLLWITGIWRFLWFGMLSMILFATAKIAKLTLMMGVILWIDHIPWRIQKLAKASC